MQQQYQQQSNRQQHAGATSAMLPGQVSMQQSQLNPSLPLAQQQQQIQYANGSHAGQQQQLGANAAFQQPGRSQMLPLVMPQPGQTKQNPAQMQSILSMPPNVLAQIARSHDYNEQRQAMGSMGIEAYIHAMALPPPSPSEELPWLNSASRSRHPASHPAIPHLLHQKFSPHTTGILAYATDPVQPFEPVYGSLDEWASLEARSIASSDDTRQLQHVAEQLKNWARSNQDNEVLKAVVATTGQAVNLAAHAAHEKRSRQNSISGGVLGQQPLGHTTQMQSVDLSAYAEHYRMELQAHAQGYYPQLHKEAMMQLNKAEASQDQSQAISSQLSRTPSTETSKYIRAAAVAALTANVLAAKDMTDAASQTLTSMGVEVSSTPAGFALSQSIPSSARAIAPELMPTSSAPSAQQMAPTAAASLGQAASPEVSAIVQQVQKTNGCTTEARDVLLRFAHQNYSSASGLDLLPLLHMIDRLHPGHCPTLLLLSCVYYSKGVALRNANNQLEARNCLEASIAMNNKILEIDDKYVEAMSNIGTTLRALGDWELAESWWYRAINLRPTYFDSVENLLGVLCNPNTTIPSNPPAPTHPRYEEALRLCTFVEEKTFGTLFEQRPYSFPASMALAHVYRLQNLFYAKGNLQSALGSPIAAKKDYEKGVELALSCGTDRSTAYTVTDVILAVIVAGQTVMARQYPQSAASTRFLTLMKGTFGIDIQNSAVTVPYLQLVKSRQAEVLPALLNLGGGLLPLALLAPSMMPYLLSMLFTSTFGQLPTIANAAVPMGLSAEDKVKNRKAAADQSSQTTSTLLLTLAKIYQDAIAAPQSVVAAELGLNGLPPSQAIVLPLYYLAIALHPSPSTYNNLGILLSTIPASTVLQTPNGPRTLTGQALAMEYYKAGLEKDPKHPHLYTNLGSLLKDLGHLPMAVQMYERAVEFNPTFDVALANLANAVKDMGHVQDSVPWYYKAVSVNPNFPEAVCGLVNALSGVCDWTDRGAAPGELGVGPSNELLNNEVPEDQLKAQNGWMMKVARLVDKQLAEGRGFGAGVIQLSGGVEAWVKIIQQALRIVSPQKLDAWRKQLATISQLGSQPDSLINEGGFLIRLVERMMRRIQRRWYIDTYGKAAKVAAPQPPITLSDQALITYKRPLLPASLPLPQVPTVLPFHTFTLPLNGRQTRLICHRNALRISHQTLSQPWLPPSVFPPPPPPSPKLRIGYVSSDFNNHPLAHLMQSVFGMHDLTRFDIFLYATTASDQSEYRQKIEREAQNFIDVSALNNQQIVERILADGIHILINMNGYTKGARNEIFAARPCPIQIQQLMGFAGTLSSGWGDWVIADQIIIPKDTVSSEIWRHRIRNAPADIGPASFAGDIDPEEATDALMYSEKMVYFPETYFITDHKQGFRDETVPNAIDAEAAWKAEEDRRWTMRHELFPNLPDNTVIFCCLNQLYKIDPLVFRVWLNILSRVPNSVMWLLRFPAAGEAHLKRTAELWAGPEIARRIIFTDVAPKQLHIARGRVADLFLDTTEVGGHTTSADVLWSGTPVITFPKHKHKLCSRVAASIAYATGFGNQMVVDSISEYEDRAVRYAKSLSYSGGMGHGELYQLRKALFQSRDQSPLFDTLKWTRHVEEAYEAMWQKWVDGTEFEDSDEFESANTMGSTSSCIHVGS